MKPFIKLIAGRLRFPRWPRLDAWLEDQRNENAVILALIIVAALVWAWGAWL